MDHALETIFGEGQVVRVALVRKDQLELWTIDEIVDLGEVLVIVGVFGLENEFEQLEVKDGLVGVRSSSMRLSSKKEGYSSASGNRQSLLEVSCLV